MKAQISARRLIAGGPPKLAMIAKSQKKDIIGFMLINPMLMTKFRELL